MGEARRKKLLDHFGSLEYLASASDEDIKKIVPLPESSLEQLHKMLKSWEKEKTDLHINDLPENAETNDFG